ncbi:MAG: hypothetical protein FJ403_05910 [Verrucomicrobia bacterium]|nr:hypothetical protein [Verrucomicrobiota bacterium]
MRKVDKEPAFEFVVDAPEQTGQAFYQLAMVTGHSEIPLPLTDKRDSLFMTIDIERVNYRLACSALAFIRRALPYWQQFKKRFKPVEQIPKTDRDVIDLLVHVDQLITDAKGIRKILNRRVTQIRRRRKPKDNYCAKKEKAVRAEISA